MPSPKSARSLYALQHYKQESPGRLLCHCGSNQISAPCRPSAPVLVCFPLWPMSAFQVPPRRDRRSHRAAATFSVCSRATSRWTRTMPRHRARVALPLARNVRGSSPHQPATHQYSAACMPYSTAHGVAIFPSGSCSGSLADCRHAALAWTERTGFLDVEDYAHRTKGRYSEVAPSLLWAPLGSPSGPGLEAWRKQSRRSSTGRLGL